MEQVLRAGLVGLAKKLDAQGLNHGTAGNVSVRCGAGLLITPSGMGAEGLTADDLVYVSMAGEFRGRWQPAIG